MEHGSKTRLVTAMVLAVVFSAGVLIGFAADTSLGAQPATVAANGAGQTEDEAGASEPERRRSLYAQLDPTSEQQALIDSIIGMHRERTNRLDKEMRAQYQGGFRQILLETRESIKGVFTSDKADEYQRLLDDWDASRAERDSGDSR